MTQTVAQRRDAARELAKRIFPSLVVANLDWDDLTAAIGAIDDTMDVLPTALTAAQTVRQNFVSRLPEPFKTTSTAQQKALALAVWAMKEGGLI